MRTATGLAIAAAVVCVPALASANVLEDASVAMTDDEATITLTAVESMGDVRLRTEPGLVRLWLSSMDDAWFDPAVTGRSLRSVRVRPGAGGTAVVQIRIGDRRTLAHESIQIERADNAVIARINRAALPADAAPAPAPIAAEPESTPEEPATEDGEEMPLAATADVDTAEPVVEDEAEEEEAVAAPPTRTTRQSPAASTIPEGEGSALGTLVLVTLLLGLLYLGAKIFASGRKKRGPRGDIEVVSAKRLGARHQLVLVRALGEDHLLSVHSGQTARITSSPSPAPEPETQADTIPKMGILGTLTGKLARRRSVSVPDTAPPARERESGPEFGAQLLEFARKAERRHSEPVARPASSSSRGNESEAVAGLLRLRQQAAR